MIVDGRMPSPEQAHEQLRQGQERKQLGELWTPLQDRVAIIEEDSA